MGEMSIVGDQFSGGGQRGPIPVERSSRLLAEASALLGDSLEYELTLTNVARLAVPELADWCSVDVLDERGLVKNIAVAHADPTKGGLAQELRRRYPEDPEAGGAVHRVLRDGEAELHPDIPESMLLEAARDREELELLRAVGMRSAMIVPLVARGRTLGAITLVAAGSGRRFGEDDFELAKQLAGRCAMALDNACLYREARGAESQFALLAEVGALLDSSLDYERTLREVVRVAVPRLADWCALHLLEGGSIRLAEVAHSHPAKERLAWQLKGRHPLDSEVPVGPARVVATGRAELLSEISDPLLEAMAQDADHLRILRGLGFRSAMVVPLRTRSGICGSLSFATAESGRSYDERSLALAQELARRCALAIENAQLYAEARASEESYRGLVESVRDYAIFMIDPGGRVVSWNAGAQEIKGYREDEVLGKHYACFFTEAEREAGEPERQLEVAAREGRHEAQGWRLRKDGSRFMAHVVTTALYKEDGSLLGFSKVIRDVTERHELEERLRHQALHDALTGLPNRTLLLDRLTHALARSDRRPGCPALLFLDIDRFKWVNDSLGHAVGDELLKAVATRVTDSVREEDTVSRFGGDEFVVLCEEITGEQEAKAVTARIIEALEPPFQIAGSELSVTASVGIVQARGQEESPESLLGDADTAMYRAKEPGSGRYAIANEHTPRQDGEPLAMQEAMREAVHLGGFEVAYQPVVDLRAPRTAGVEALVRWEHPTRGALKPNSFIPMAEETGLIHSLGAFVLRTACAQAQEWNAQAPERSDLCLFVNVSAGQLANSDFTETTLRTLDETGLDPETLCLEITETTMMGNGTSMLRTMANLRDIGVCFAVDDFGTGYSSLNHLKRFTPDYLKVDSSFVAGLGQHADDQALVEGMTSLAHALGITVVAEGVESAAQLAQLKRLGCEFAQGYYLARPQLAATGDRLPSLEHVGTP